MQHEGAIGQGDLQKTSQASGSRDGEEPAVTSQDIRRPNQELQKAKKTEKQKRYEKAEKGQNAIHELNQRKNKSMQSSA